MALIALQLLKRWRNVQYDGREGRCPPSVMLAKSVAENANQTDTLSEELLYQARCLAKMFDEAMQRKELVVMSNPACDGDIFTDRWPGTLANQAVFANDLATLVLRLKELRAEGQLPRMQEILAELFGERATLDAVRSFVDGNGKSIANGHSHHVPGSGRFVVPGASTLAGITPAAARVTPGHTFFGE
jgi:hypothetical protein